MSDQKQTVLDISPVKNLRYFYRFCTVGATISLLACLLFIVLLVFNYFAPYQFHRLDEELDRQAKAVTGTNDAGSEQDDFVLDGPEEETAGEKAGTTEELPTLSERFPFAFLTLPTEHKEYLALREQLLRKPDDVTLQSQVRAMDLILRQQYFARRTRAKTGSFLFLASLAIGILFAATASSIKRRLPVVKMEEGCNHHRHMNERQYQLKSIVAIGILGGLGAGIILGMYLSSRSELEQFLSERTGKPIPTASSSPASSSGTGATASDQSPAITDETQVDPAKERDKFLEVWNRNWGTFRGPFAYGHVNEKDLAAFSNSAHGSYVDTWDEKTGENILWRTPVPLSGHNSPVVWGERVFLAGSNENERKVFCFHTNTGKLLWETAIPNVGEKIDPDSLNQDTGFAASTMVTDGLKVYAIFPNGDITAIDYGGKIVWSKNLGNVESQYGYASSLALWFDRVIVQIDVESEDESKPEARIMAISTADGKELWKTLRSGSHASWSSPVVYRIGETWQIIVMGDPHLASYDPQTGKELWRYTGFKTDVAVSPIATGTTVYAVHTFPNFVAIDGTGRGELAKTPKTLWTAESSGLPNACGPVPIPGGVIFLSENGSLTGIDIKEKKTVWELFVDEEDSFYASPVYAGNLVYLFAKSEENPSAYVIDASKINPKTVPEEAIDLIEVKGALLKKIPMSKPVYASPALKDGRIFVRDTTSIYCIGKKTDSDK